MILFVSMDTEESANLEQNKIQKLLEEAAKRHREIELKIHPEKFAINISGAQEEKTSDKVMPVKNKETTEESVTAIDEDHAEQTKPLVETGPQAEIRSKLKVMPEAHDKIADESELAEQSKDAEDTLPYDAPAIKDEPGLPDINKAGENGHDEEISQVAIVDISSRLDDLTDLDDSKGVMNDSSNLLSKNTRDTETKEIKTEDTGAESPVTSVETQEKTEAVLEPVPVQEPFITEFDLHLFSKGTFYRIFEKFGAQLHSQDGVDGVSFTTWAPNAEKVYLIGEFNGWRENENFRLKRIHDNLGVWSAFFPGLKEGDTYKYSIKSKVDGDLRRKADPYAFRSEVRPKNASIVTDINKYSWNDENWMSARKAGAFRSKPLNIFEVHLGSWRRDRNNSEFPNEWGYLSYSQLAHEIVDYVKKMRYTHIELMPVMEHPLDISWGYQVTQYYAPTSRFGQPDDFKYFVDYCHQNGIGVILDWVPAHFPYDEHALAFFDGRQIYAYENSKRGYQKDWGTFVFDYGKHEVQNFLIGSALFWLEKYHADGLRVDAVASMLYLDYSRNQGDWEPNIHGGREHLEAIEFIKHLNSKVHEYHIGALMIAEESTSWPGVSHPLNEGGLGFDLKWNMGWMNDILLYFSKDPVYRKYHQGKITFSLWYAFSENFVLPISHDEVVHGKKSLLEKMPGDNWQKFANMRLFLGFMIGHPGKKLNFMTTDIAQYNEWNSEESVDWNLLDLDLNKKLNLFARDLNSLYKEHSSLFEVDFQNEGFRWIDFSDALHSVLSFIRLSRDKDEILLLTFNMTPTIRYDYQIGVPAPGFWKEILNSDAEIYGGSGTGNMGGKQSEPLPFKEWKNSIRVTLPPLAVNIYKFEKKIEIPKPAGTSAKKRLDEFEQMYVDMDTGGGE